MMSSAELERWLVMTVADRCGLPLEEIEIDRPLVDYGLSSRDAVELSGWLEELLDRTLPSTLIWDHPTIGQLAAALLGQAALAPPTGPDVVSGRGGEDPDAVGMATDAAGEATDAAGRATDAVDGATGAAGRATDAAGADADAIAVVGLSVRLPGGVAGPEDFWRLLQTGAHAVGELPPERWLEPDTAADRHVIARTTRIGGFLRDIAGFDAEFFGISPVEARRMDPQQRMVLEVAWEALEHAGISPESLRGSPAGVFVGISAAEYGQRSLSALSAVDAWSGTGGALSIAANRLSYALDLRGPSAAVDTACSSSLVAVHLGIQSLRAGESNLVLAAGANLLLGPEVTAAFHQMGVISAVGRCQPFSASADGIVRAEGAGVVVLKRLADAHRDGDRVLAVLRGSAVNQDGRSNGLTAPNVGAQEDLLRAAYGRAGIDPRDVDYVEAHGTGTLLGDPIEARALGAVLGHGRDESARLLIGSVKSNLGHLEAAAGIIGLIKLVLAIDRGQIPASLHASERNPHIDFDALGLSVVDQLTAWPAANRPARAGVSAFGFGGTNAHVVVEAAQDPPATRTAPDPPASRTAVERGAADGSVTRLVLGGPDPTRVGDAAGRLADWLESDGAHARLADVAHTLGRRLSGRDRAAVVGRDRSSLIDALRVCASGGSGPHVVSGRPGGMDAGPVWVFSGQGSQWAGMALGLARDEPVFAQALAEVDDAIHTETGFSVRGELERRTEITAIDRLQPVLFAVQVALARLLHANGLRPAAVVGHSLGEVAAAVTIGALSIADAAHVVALRSRLLATLAGTGAMALLELSPGELEAVRGEHDSVEIAAFNAPRQIATGGAVAEITQLVEAVEARGLLARLIKSTVAGHCSLVDPIVGALTDGLRALAPSTPDTRLYTTVLEDPRATPSFDADYWTANIRRPVRFAQAIAAAAADGHRTFIEISPHPVLLHALSDNARACGVADPVILATGRRSDDETLHLHAQLAALAINRPATSTPGGEDARLIDLPTTRWRHTRHWLEPREPRRAVATHGLIGARVELPDPTRIVWQSELDPSDARPGAVQAAGAGGPAATLGAATLGAATLGAATIGIGRWLELIASAATEAFGGPPPDTLLIGDLALHAPLPIGDHGTLSTAVEPTSPSTGRVTVHSSVSPGRWRAHLTATIETSTDGTALAPLQGVPSRVLLRPVTTAAGSAGAPSPLDGALDAIASSLEAVGDDAWVVRSIGLARIVGPLEEAVFAATSLDGPVLADERTARLQLADADGRVLVELDEIRMRRVARASLAVLSTVHGTSGTSAPEWDARWLEADADAARPDRAAAGERIEDRVRERIAAVLGDGPGRLDGDIALTAIGLDSLLAVRVRNVLADDFGRALPPSLLLRGATVNDVVRWLRSALALPSAPDEADPPDSPDPRVAPRDATERIVAAVWAEVLGRDDFGVTQTFGGLGGDPAAALQAGALLAQRTGRAVVASELFADAMTIERQASLLRAPEAAGDGSLRLLREGHAPTPLFLFHPAGGDTLVYRQLVDHLDPGLTVWGCDRFDAPLSVQQRAARYAERLAELAPSGPYLLAGWSFGGLLAYETAQVLRAAGERVELVALVDTILPRADPPGSTEAEVLALRFERFAAFLETSYGKPVSLPYERLAGLDDDAQVDVVIEAIVAGGLIDPQENAAILRHQRTSYLDLRAAERYTPAPYDGRVVLYSPRERQTGGVRDPRFDRQDASRGWDAFCGERLEIVRVPGHHLSLLDPPNVETLAGHLSLLLADRRLSAA